MLQLGKIYIGSSVNLGRRLRDYYNYSFLSHKNKKKNMIINKAAPLSFSLRPQSIRTMLIVEWIGGEWEAASLSLLPTFHNYTSSSCEKWGGEAERGDALLKKGYSNFSLEILEYC
uniref:GIY-YIG domain-containing protein n=1 Tax=Morchella brunnea TaxID=1174671 RepID=A0A8K1I7T9_9PEZI|nr:hypothetical protein LK370_mgp225 [Morchella brunnea]UBU98429.1 hypothetical protein [Morchella brunnea]